MEQINIQEAKTHFSRYVERALKGDVILICRHNKPVAELRGVSSAAKRVARVAGLLKGQMHWTADAFDPMSPAEVAEFDGAPVFPPVRHE